ncbi:MAG TPA: hypothetical protein VFZ58_03115 [Candidatus Saccharimonadales bacterium]
MFTTNKQRTMVILVAAICATAVILGIITLISSNNNRRTEADAVAEQRANTNIDAGITELFKLGVTSYQIDSMKNGLYQFAQHVDKDIAKMTINIDSIDRITSNKGEVSEDYVIYTIELDDKQYNAHVNLPGMSSAQVIISEGETQKFDSGVIDLAARGIDR